MLTAHATKVEFPSKCIFSSTNDEVNSNVRQIAVNVVITEAVAGFSALKFHFYSKVQTSQICFIFTQKPAIAFCLLLTAHTTKAKFIHKCFFLYK